MDTDDRDDDHDDDDYDDDDLSIYVCVQIPLAADLTDCDGHCDGDCDGECDCESPVPTNIFQGLPPPWVRVHRGSSLSDFIMHINLVPWHMQVHVGPCGLLFCLFGFFFLRNAKTVQVLEIHVTLKTRLLG